MAITRIQTQTTQQPLLFKAKQASSPIRFASQQTGDLFVKSAKPAQPKFGSGFVSILDSARGLYDKIVSGEIEFKPSHVEQMAMSRMERMQADAASPSEMRQLFKSQLKDNIVFLEGPVSDQMAAFLDQRVGLLVSAMQLTGEVTPIRLYISSPGGSILSMNKILDIMDRVKASTIKTTDESGNEVEKPLILETYCQGYAASAASLMMSNGTPGHRFIAPRAQIMIHQPLGGAEGQATDIGLRNDQIQRMKRELNEHFLKTTKVLDTKTPEGCRALKEKLCAAFASIQESGDKEAIAALSDMPNPTDIDETKAKPLNGLYYDMLKSDNEIISAEAKKFMTDVRMAEVMERDYWMSAEESVNLGFVDKVVDTFVA